MTDVAENAIVSPTAAVPVAANVTVEPPTVGALLVATAKVLPLARVTVAVIGVVVAKVKPPDSVSVRVPAGISPRAPTVTVASGAAVAAPFDTTFVVVGAEVAAANTVPANATPRSVASIVAERPTLIALRVIPKVWFPPRSSVVDAGPQPGCRGP